MLHRYSISNISCYFGEIVGYPFFSPWCEMSLNILCVCAVGDTAGGSGALSGPFVKHFGCLLVLRYVPPVHLPRCQTHTLFLMRCCSEGPRAGLITSPLAQYPTYLRVWCFWFCFIFGILVTGTQGLEHTGQVFCHWAPSLSSSGASLYQYFSWIFP